MTNRIKTFDEFISKNMSIDESLSLLHNYGDVGVLNESHVYFDGVCSVMDKLEYYTTRKTRIYRSNISESLKRKINKDVKFDESEKTGVDIIFTEMTKKYGESLKEEIEFYDRVISGDSDAINETLYCAFGDECEILFEGIGSWIKDKTKKGKEAAEKLGNKTKEVFNKGMNKISDLIDNAKEFAKVLKSQVEERFFGFIKVLKEIIKNAKEGVESFIESTIEVFSKLAEDCGGLFSKVIEKLGGDKIDKDEKPDNIEVKGVDVYKNIENKGLQCFMSHVISGVSARWKEYAEKEDVFKKQLHESKNESGEVDSDIDEISKESKFREFLKKFKTTVTNTNFLKSILISLSISVFMFILPHILVGMGTTLPIAAFIVALINFGLSVRGFFKFVKTRRAQMKEEGSTGIKGFFAKKSTYLFMALSLLSLVMSSMNLVNTFGPFVAELCKIFKIDSNSEGVGKLLYALCEKVAPGSITDAKVDKILEEHAHGLDASGLDFEKNLKETLGALKDAGVPQDQINNVERFLKAGGDAHTSMGVIRDQMRIIDSIKPEDMVAGGTFDMSGVKDATERTAQLFQKAKDMGIFDENTIMVQSGNAMMVTKSLAKGGEIVGDNITILNASADQCAQFQSLLINELGIKQSQSCMQTFGSNFFGSTTTEHLIATATQYNVPTPVLMFTPLFIPFFDKSLDGKFKMRFSSATRGYPAYVVSTKKTEVVDTAKLKDLSGDAPAVSKLITIHENTWKESKSLLDEKNSSEDKKKKKNEPKIEEPGFVVIYVNTNEDTGNEKDKEDGKSKDKKKDEIQPGIVIDTLTMMCADICPFNKNRRSQPYYLKGLLSRLSFRPTKDRDNGIKQKIRELLGRTMQTSIAQCAKFGLGQKFVEVDNSDKKHPKFVVKEGVGNKDNTEIGNLTPQEMVDCLNDDSKNDKKSYDLLDGRFATRVNVSTDKNGKPKISARQDSTAIEFVKYYKVSEKEKKELMNEYEKKLKKFKDGERKTKPTKPKFNTVKIDGKDVIYKKLSKVTQKRLKLKDDEIFDFVDVKILPLLTDTSSEVYKKLNDDKDIKKVLYPDGELDKNLITLLKPFLYRPEKTFSKNDDYVLNSIIGDENSNKEVKKKWWEKFKDKLGWSDEKFHDTFKDIVEIIWDELSDKTRTKYGKKVDNRKKTSESLNDSVEYSLFDQLVEEYLEDSEITFDDIQYDELICEMREKDDFDLNFSGVILMREDFLSRYHR